jgi:hypothetical protein
VKLRYLATATIIGITSVLAVGRPAVTLQPNPLFAVLLGGNEVGANNQANAGDPNGAGSATVIIIPGTSTQGRLCYGLTVNNIANPNAAHIHRGNAGTNGGIVVNLTAPAAGNPGHSSGCVSVANSVLTQIQSDPSGFYVNIHNTQYPNGAIRGQLF